MKIYEQINRNTDGSRRFRLPRFTFECKIEDNVSVLSRLQSQIRVSLSLTCQSVRIYAAPVGAYASVPRKGLCPEKIDPGGKFPRNLSIRIDQGWNE